MKKQTQKKSRKKNYIFFKKITCKSDKNVVLQDQQKKKGQLKSCMVVNMTKVYVKDFFGNDTEMQK